MLKKYVSCCLDTTIFAEARAARRAKAEAIVNDPEQWAKYRAAFHRQTRWRSKVYYVEWRLVTDMP